ncbi:MAG: ArsR family transcriptional regulator [Bacteroidales bacterium]|jgi:predicted ArsR family transcriptional regulator|nr:ArsR family transcriptional regulator [Bacteroidales bacterium]
MLDALITSKTRIKLLMKFFLNSSSESYLRNLEDEFGESTNAIRIELNKFEKAGLLNSRSAGNKKMFRANTQHPLFPNIHNLLRKHFGFDQIIDKVVKNLGDIEQVFLVGKFARGIDTDIIDLIFMGEGVNKNYLSELVEKSEELISRKIRYMVFSASEMQKYLKLHASTDFLLLWGKE